MILQKKESSLNELNNILQETIGLKFVKKKYSNRNFNLKAISFLKINVYLNYYYLYKSLSSFIEKVCFPHFFKQKTIFFVKIGKTKG